MAERSVRKGDRFRWWISDRSGLQFGFVPLTSRPNDYTREAGRPVRDNGIQVAPDEFDTPLPSTKSLGGEGEIGTGARANSTDVNDIPPESVTRVQYLVASTKIQWNQDNIPLYVVGSLNNVTLDANPLSNGIQGLYISIQGVGSSVTINSGNGISIDFNKSNIRLDSGGIATLIYNATDSTWHITSFNAQGAV